MREPARQQVLQRCVYLAPRTAVHDTLCGTKVLFKRDDEKIAANRDYFGDFNPFGDGAQVTWRAGIATSHARIGAGWDRVR
jgi:hypothetical protein